MPGILDSIGNALFGAQVAKQAYNPQGLPKAFSARVGGNQGSVNGVATNTSNGQGFIGPQLGAASSQGYGQAPAAKTVAPLNQNPFGDPTQLQNQIKTADASFMDSINQDYEATLSSLSRSEGDVNASGAAQISQADANAAPVRAQIGAEQTARTDTLNANQQTGEQNYNKGLEQARQAYSELDQRNQALAAGSGLSSSSVTQALSERLGRQTAAQLSDLSDNFTAFSNAISKEKDNTVKYYQSKLTDLETQLSQFKNQIGMETRRQLNAIQGARDMAAGQKAQQKAGLAQQARDALQQAFQQSQQYAASLQMWQTQRQAALDDAHNYQSQQIQTFNPSAQVSAIQSQNPNLELQGATIGSNGNPSYKLGLPKKSGSKVEDQINQLFGG